MGEIGPFTDAERRYFARNRKRYPDQAWYWTEEWQAGERESERDYALGNVETFDSADDMIRWLDR